MSQIFIGRLEDWKSSNISLFFIFSSIIAVILKQFIILSFNAVFLFLTFTRFVLYLT